MKTTIDIANGRAGPVLRKARKLAARDGTTLRALVEQGLRRVLDEWERKHGFRLRDASVKGGSGLSPEFVEGGWEKMREAIYEGRGG